MEVFSIYHIIICILLGMNIFMFFLLLYIVLQIKGKLNIESLLSEIENLTNVIRFNKELVIRFNKELDEIINIVYKNKISSVNKIHDSLKRKNSNVTPGYFGNNKINSINTPRKVSGNIRVFDVQVDPSQKVIPKKNSDYFFIETDGQHYYLKVKNRILNSNPTMEFDNMLQNAFELSLRKYNKYKLVNSALVKWDKKTNNGRILNRGLIWR